MSENKDTVKDANVEARGVKELDKELSALMDTMPQKQASQKKAPKRTARQRKSAKQESRPMLSKAKRKEAVARASMIKGNGRIRINGIDVNLIKPLEIRELILEPVRLSKTAKEIAENSDIDIEIDGGGISGRAQAARNALAKVIANSPGGEGLRKEYMGYDRNMLIDDHRRVEPKKFKGPKARARFQTSYR